MNNTDHIAASRNPTACGRSVATSRSTANDPATMTSGTAQSPHPPVTFIHPLSAVSYGTVLPGMPASPCP